MCKTISSLLVVMVVVGCGEDVRPDLFVDIRTDLRPGLEFQAVRVDLVGAGAAGPSRVERLATADEDSRYLDGIRVAEFEDVDRSRARVHVVLLDWRGASLVERTASVRLERHNRVVTVVLTRDCTGVSCPGAGDDAALVACLGGRCVDPRCTPETPEHCPTGCTADSECAVGASCATGRCDHGTCFRVERDEACNELEWCHPEDGCVPLPDAPDAAVFRDGGTDAAEPTDGGVDADMSPDAAMDAGACATDCGSRKTLSAGGSSTCSIKAGRLYCWGNNAEGQLGFGDTTDRRTPEMVGSATNWAEIISGGNTTCGVKSDGTGWCWGDNSVGQLGQGDTTARHTPTQLPLPSGFSGTVDLLRMSAHGCMTDSEGSLWCWGWNSEGELGLGDNTDRLEPTGVPVGTGCTAVALGAGHTLAIVGGDLYAWGGNDVDQLGLGSSSPIQVRDPNLVPTGGPFIHVAAGQDHSCAVSADGSLSCWGANGAAQLGTGDRTDRDVPTVADSSGDWLLVEVSAFHSCGIRAPGSLWCWGRGVEGQLGQGNYDDLLVPTRVGSATDWVEVDLGRFHTCAKRSDGTVWCAGKNDGYQLGTGDTTWHDVLTEIVIP